MTEKVCEQWADTTVSERVESARLARGMTRKDVSESARVSVSYIGALERGEDACSHPLPNTAGAIAGALGCNEEWVSTGAGQAPAGAWLQLTAMRARRAAEAEKETP